MGAIRSISRGVALAGAVVAGGALAVTASSVLATPQPLESALEGESRIFRFREGDVFYKVRGPADAQPVLLLHSVHLSASSFEWRKNFSALSQTFRVYAPDLPGFGLSDRPAIDYTADLYVQLIADFTREVIARPTIVVARNQSAAFAARAAYLDSQLFTRLAFISPSGIISPAALESRDWPSWSGGPMQSLLRRVSETIAGQVPYAFLTTRPALSWLVARQSYANPEHVTPEVVQHLYATTHQFGARFAPLAFMSGKLDIDVGSDFAALRQPMLLVWGEQDAINDPVHAEALSKLNQHTRLELIAQAGNAAQEEQANEVNELLHAWFLAPPELVDPMLKEQASLTAPSTAAPAAQGTPAEPPAPAAQPPQPEPTPAPEASASPVMPVAQGEMPARVEEAAPDAAETPPGDAQGPAPAVPEAGTPETARGASEARRQGTPRSGGTRRAASGQARPSRAAQQAPQRERARQARPDSGDTPQPPQPADGPERAGE